MTELKAGQAAEVSADVVRYAPMVGGGNLDFYAAVVTIYPLIGLALLVESRLSAQTQESLPRQTPEARWTRHQVQQFYWRVLPVMLGLAFGVAGMFAALKALVDGRTTRHEFWIADAALGLEAEALLILLVYHIWEMTRSRRVAWVGLLLVVLFLVVLGYGITHP